MDRFETKIVTLKNTIAVLIDGTSIMHVWEKQYWNRQKLEHEFDDSQDNVTVHRQIKE